MENACKLHLHSHGGVLPDEHESVYGQLMPFIPYAAVSTGVSLGPATVAGGDHTEDASFHYYAFTATGADTLTVSTSGLIDVLVVGGGGGGGCYSGGGGGGGDVLFVEDVLVPVGAVTVTIGAGGAGAPAAHGGVRAVPGSPASFGVFLVAAGGGGGGTSEQHRR